VLIRKESENMLHPRRSKRTYHPRSAIPLSLRNIQLQAAPENEECPKDEKGEYILPLPDNHKDALKAFLLTFFLGAYGAGRFYYGYIWQGVLQLMIGLMGCYGQCAIRMAASSPSGKEDLAGPMLALICCLCGCVIGMFGWLIADLIQIAQYNLGPVNGCLVHSIN